MKERILIYLVLEIRAVFLCAKNSVEIFFSKLQFEMFPTLRIFLVLFILASSNFQVFSQESNCPPGQRFCRGECKPARQCGGPPPPPGLPLDSKLPYLLIAGLGLGIYYVRSRKRLN